MGEAEEGMCMEWDDERSLMNDSYELRIGDSGRAAVSRGSVWETKHEICLSPARMAPGHSH